MTVRSGFTLVELLVSITLGSILMIALLGAFISFITYQAYGQDERTALETINFAVDSITRELYFGYEYTCGDGKTSVGAPPDFERCSCISFKDQLGRQVKYRLNKPLMESGFVEKSTKILSTNPTSCVNGDGWVPLSSNATDITTLQFLLTTEESQQPRVGIEVSATYKVGSGTTEEEKTFSTHTQVTRRILEPSEDVAATFRVNTDIADFSSQLYVAYNSNGICVDSTNAQYDSRPESSFNPCEQKVGPIAVELVRAGAFMLLENGLLVFTPNATLEGIRNIRNAGEVHGGDIFVEAETVVNASSMVTASDNIFDDDTPKNIVELYVGGSMDQTLFARSRLGDLYRVEVSGNSATPKRILAGNQTNPEVLFTTYRNTAIILFTDSDSEKQFWYYTSLPTVIDDCNGVFLIESSNNNCFKLKDDSQTPIPDYLSDSDEDDLDFVKAKLTAELDVLILSSVDYIKAWRSNIGVTFAIWYRDRDGDRKFLRVWPPNRLFVDRGNFVVGADPNYVHTAQPPLTFDLRSYNWFYLCSDTSGAKGVCSSEGVEHGSSLSTPTLDAGVELRDIVKFWSGGEEDIFGIDTGGNLYSLRGVGTTQFTQKDFTILQGKSKVDAFENVSFCDTSPPSVEEALNSVSFTYLSEAHPLSASETRPPSDRNNYFLATASVEFFNTQENRLERRSELFIINPINFRWLENTCGDTLYIERYALRSPNSSGNPSTRIDLIRLNGVRFNAGGNKP